MIRSDNHLHTSFSSDSSTPMEDMISRAKALGLSSLCFTDHMDYGFPVEKEGMDFLFPPDDYVNKISLLTEQFPDFSLRTGVELGLKKDILPLASALTSGYRFDFIIGSTHLVDNVDPYNAEYWEINGEDQGIRRYYEATLENISAGFDFDVYGHIDYVIRYCPSIRKARQTRTVDEKYYQQTIRANADILDEILLALIRSDRGIEVNTGGLAYMLGHPNPHEDILRRYRALGGELLSVGSDAHKTESLAYAFDKLPALLRGCGFTHYTEFHNRKPVQIAL